MPNGLPLGRPGGGGGGGDAPDPPTLLHALTWGYSIAISSSYIQTLGHPLSLWLNENHDKIYVHKNCL